MKIESRLQEIQETLSTVDRPPTTTLDILGESKQERYWQALLVYFLDNNNPHGLNTDVLEAFVNALAAHNDIALPRERGKLEDVKVQSEVPTGNGPFDILLWCKDSWYVCIELKVDSGETGSQTERYAQASELGDLVVDQHDGVGEYVYLAPSDAQPPKSDTFVDISWEHVVPYFEDVLRTDRGQYPSKSRAQFADYLDTITQTLNMDELTTISEETRLYTEYADTIDRLLDSYEKDKNKIFKGLETAFFADLNGNRQDWISNNRPKRYINFAKEDWGNVGSGVTIEYEPHVHLNRDNPRILLRLDIEHGEKQKIRNQLSNKLSQGEVDSLQEDGWEIVDGGYAYISKPVTLDLENPDDSIQHASKELHKLREVVEPYIEEIVTENQDSDRTDN